MRRLILFILLCSLGGPALAQRFEGTVTRVIDGDSLEVRRGAFGRASEIRLAGIDAPEFRQPYGRQARAALAAMVDGRRVRVQVTDRDRYGRLVARVEADGRYVNAAMAAGGHAWAFTRFYRDAAITRAAERARLQRLGLWALPPGQRIPPPAWREAHPRRPER